MTQGRAASSGRFQRVVASRFREAIGAPARVGRPSVVTPDLAEEGKRLLRGGATIRAMCEHLGIDQRSWYRFVHATNPSSVRPKAVRRRRGNAISREVEKRIMRLESEGLTRVLIAERVGLHINTVVKYLLRAGRRKS